MNRVHHGGGALGAEGGDPDDAGAADIAPAPADSPVAAWIVRPRPDEDEVAALVAVLTGRSGGDDQGDATPPAEVSRWAMSGRRAAVRGLAGGPCSGWGRARRSDR